VASHVRDDLTIDKLRVRRRFNRHSASYDRYAQVQLVMARQLLDRLAAAGAAPQSILELGCGTGLLTELLARRFPDTPIAAIDLAERMLQAAQARLGTESAVDFLVGDIEQRPWGERRFGLIASNATIQWLSAPAATMQSLVEALEPGGLMVHTTFGPRTFEELFAVLDGVELGHGVVPGRHGLDLRSTEQWSTLLAGQGLVEVDVTSSLVRRDYISCRACLAEIRGTGASTTPGEALAPGLLTEVMRHYDSTYTAASGVYATYELLQLVARRPSG
jgi:malonyl-CoA O-methyltransferase